MKLYEATKPDYIFMDITFPDDDGIEVLKTIQKLAKLENDNVIIEYFCMDASSFLLETINKSIHGIVFFSATLYPIDYHCNLLTHL